MSAFPALTRGHCGTCGYRFLKGDPIRYHMQSPTNFVHDDCDKALAKARAEATR